MVPAALSLAVLCAAALPLLPPQEPFPTDKTTTLRAEGVNYFVEGQQRIENHVKISSLRRTKLTGRGKGAVLQVDGTLELKAVTGGEVQVQDLFIEVLPGCKSLYLSGVKFGKNSGVRSLAEAPNKAVIYMEHCQFDPGTFEIDMTAGTLDFQTVHSRNEVVIKGSSPTPKSSNNTKVLIMGCMGNRDGNRPRALSGGLTVTGIKDCLIRNNDLGGERTLFQDCAKIMFDGNNARSQTTEFRQTKYGKFKGLTFKKTDVRSEELILFAPAKGKKQERVMLENCWFGGAEDPETIRSTVVVDSLRDPGCGTLAMFKKTSTKPLGFGGARQ
jgi:hypothetical protein